MHSIGTSTVAYTVVFMQVCGGKFEHHLLWNDSVDADCRHGKEASC